MIISAGVGAGHDGPADELARRLLARGWQVDRRDGLTILPGSWGGWLRNLYLAHVRTAPRSWGWVLAASGGGWLHHLVQRLLDRLTRRTSALVGGPSDLVVSTYPLVSQLLGRLRAAGELECPVVTYLTDMSMHPLWCHPGVDHVLALGPVPAREARARGALSVHQCAPAVAPEFTGLVARTDGQATRRELGVPERAIAALVTSGSAGTGDVFATARDVAALGAFPIVLCARNQRLLRKVERAGFGRALSWTDRIPALLEASDVVVQNAGGLASLEALVARRPVLSYRVLPGHGEANAQALDAGGLAPWIRSRAALRAALSSGRNAPPGGIPTSAASAVARLRAAPDPAEVLEDIALGGSGGLRTMPDATLSPGQGLAGAESHAAARVGPWVKTGGLGGGPPRVSVGGVSVGGVSAADDVDPHPGTKR